MYYPVEGILVNIFGGIIQCDMVKDIRSDISDDGALNYSAGADVDQMQEVLEDAVDSLLQENV